MAISDARVSLNNVVENTKSTFLNAIDKSKDTSSNSTISLSNSIKSSLNKKALSAGMTSYINNMANNTVQKTSKLGIYDNNTSIDCSTGIQNGDNTPDKRNFDSNGKKLVNCAKNNNVIDVIYNTENNIRASIASVSDKALSNIETVANKEVKNIIKKTGISSNAISNIDVSKRIANSMSSLGGTLGIKNGLKSVSNICDTDAYTAGDSNIINSFTLDSLLGNIDCLDPTVILKTISSLLTNGIGSASDIISSIGKNFTTNEDPLIINKLKILSTTLDATKSNRTPKDILTTKGQVDNILTSLKSNVKLTAGPATDYQVLSSTLDKLDYNWDKDISGTPNYHKTNGNEYINKLALSNLSSMSPSNSLSTTPTVNNDKLRSLGIIASNTKNTYA